MEHTPGPWKLVDCRREDGIGHIQIANHKEGVGIAEIRHRYGFSPQWIDECKANAHLIAAAPDLLKSLQELLACNLHENLHGGFQFQIEQAQATFDKAVTGHF